MSDRQPIHGTFPPAPVSTTPMASTSRWRRILRITAFTVGVLLLGTVALVRIQQQILRWRAERLLSDIRSLQLGRSTWADAQKIMTRWGAWGFYEGSCTEKRCAYQIAFRDVSRTFLVMSVPDGSLHAEPQEHNAWILKAYRILGGQSALIAARVEVIDGVIWGKDYELYLNIPGGSNMNEGEYVLAAYAETVWKSKDLHSSYTAIPTDYRIGRREPCSGCESIEAQYTPYADPKFISDVMNFNLDCLTRLILCRHPEQIAPGMWQRADEDERNAKKSGDGSPANLCPISPEVLGREQENGALVEVMETHIEQSQSGPSPVTAFRLKQRLKRAEFWNEGDLIRAGTADEQTVVRETGRTGLFKPGNKVILIFETPWRQTPVHQIGLDFCRVLPATDENLAAFLRGVHEDVFPVPKDSSP